MTDMKKSPFLCLWAFIRLLCSWHSNNELENQTRLVPRDFNSSYLDGGPPLIFLGPVLFPGVDRASKTNLVPISSHNISYGSVSRLYETRTQKTMIARVPQFPPRLPLSKHGHISANSTFFFKHPTIMLENIETVSNVTWSPSRNILAVIFTSVDSMFDALMQWKRYDEFLLVTNHNGCGDSSIGRSYFLANHVTRGHTAHSLNVSVCKKDIKEVVSNIQMFFSSTAIPGGEDLENWQHYAANDKKVANRPVISPSMMMTFSQELPPNTTILSWPSFIHVVSNTAYMLASLEFSGYLDYDMDNMTVNQLYVDIDCKCETLLSMTASVHQEFQKTVDLALIRTNNIPQINIPNVISIAPVLSFAVQVNMAAKSAFVAASTYKVEIPDAKVHLDILHPGKTGLSGFTPKYYVEANATEDVAAHFNISTTLDVGLSLQIVNFVGFDCRFNLTTKVNNLVSVDGKQGIKLDDDTEMGDGPLISAPALATATAPEVTGDGKVGSNGETALGTTETVAEITSRVIDNGCGENKVRLYSEFLLDFGINNMSLFQDSKVLLNVCDDLWI